MFGMMFSQVGQRSGERKSKLNSDRRDYLGAEDFKQVQIDYKAPSQDTVPNKQLPT